MRQRWALSNRMVAALEVERSTVFWDRSLIGFGVRVYPSGGKVYVARARGPGGSGAKRVTVGRHGVIGTAEARRRAASIIARIKSGEEPVPPAVASRVPDGPTVAELAERYLEEHVAVNCKPATARDARSVMHRHILPALGLLPLRAVEPGQVENLHRRLAGSPATANKAVRTLSHMFTLADDWGLVSEGFNPCRSVTKYPERKRKRRLSDAELDRLERVLDEAAVIGISVAAAAAIRLMIETGCRRNQILTLRWADVGTAQGKIRLRDGKSGFRAVRVSPSTMRQLIALPRKEGNPWLFPGRKPGTHMSGIDEAWRTVRAKAELDDMRIDDLRDSLLLYTPGCRGNAPTTERLASVDEVDLVTREAAERVANRIAAHIF